MGIVLPQIARAFAGTPNAALLSQLIEDYGPLVCGRLAPRRRLIVVWLSTYLFLVICSIRRRRDQCHFGSIISTHSHHTCRAWCVGRGALVAAITGIGLLPGREQAKLLGVFTLVGGCIGAHFLLCRCSTSEFGWRAPLCAAFARYSGIR